MVVNVSSVHYISRLEASLFSSPSVIRLGLDMFQIRCDSVRMETRHTHPRLILPWLNTINESTKALDLKIHIVDAIVTKLIHLS